MLLLSLAMWPLSAQTSLSDAITEKNWIDHPAIKEIRAIFTEVEQGIKAKRLIKLSIGPAGVQAWGLDEGHTRKLSLEHGSEDAMVLLDHYYDPAGVLRFVFGRANAVNGTQVEYRLYFNVRSELIWENRRQITGPGYTFPDQVPSEWLVADPYTLVNGD